MFAPRRSASAASPCAHRSSKSEFFLKCEHLQPMGAFKMRGACNFLAQLSPEARAAGVITYSSGNHGQAVALAAQRLGLPCVVVMPETAPRVKVDGVRTLRRRSDLRGHDVGRSQDARGSGGRRSRAHHRAAVRSPLDHRRRRDVRPRDSRAVSGRVRCLRSDRWRWTALRNLDRHQSAEARGSCDWRRTRRRRADDRIPSGRSSCATREDYEHRRRPADAATGHAHLRAHPGVRRRRS